MKNEEFQNSENNRNVKMLKIEITGNEQFF